MEEKNGIFLHRPAYRGGWPWILNGTEPGYRKTNANIFFPPHLDENCIGTSRCNCLAFLRAHRTRVGRWQCTGGLAPDTPYVWLRSPGEFSCTRRRSPFNRVTIYIDIPQMSLAHDQLSVLSIYSFIKKNDRKKRKKYFPLYPSTNLRWDIYIEKSFAPFYHLALHQAKSLIFPSRQLI